MGIKGLNLYMEEHLPGACYLVDIPREVNEYITETGRNPTIVVDMHSCDQMNYNPATLKWFVGYEIQEYIHRVRVFVESFKKLNVELVFFFGGLRPANRMRHWLYKQREDIAAVHRAIDSLKAKGFLPSNFHLVQNTRLIRACIIKYVFGCEVKMTSKNIREEIIEYVKLHDQCFAIFCHNSNFIASQVNAHVWSSKHFVLGNMTTKSYDREELALRLGLHVKQLPLLAIMAGNDAFRKEDIDDFHRRFYSDERGRKMPYKQLIPAIAGHLSKIAPHVSIEVTLKHLATSIFQDSSRVESLRKSYDSYFGFAVKPRVQIPRPTDGWPFILYVAEDRYRNNLLPSDAYSVMCRLTFMDDTSFEDLRNGSHTLTRDLPTSKVLRPLRSRLYGILLFEKKDEDPSVSVREWCNEHSCSYTELVVVEPVRPDVHHPGLLNLWWRSDDDDINEVRWTLFLTTIAPSVRPSKWQSFDDVLMLSTLTVSHLYEREFFNEPELDAVLATIATYPLYANGSPPPACEEIQYVHARATDITIALSRTFLLVLMVLATCGYPSKLSENNAFLKFDGKVFQIKYARVVMDNADIESLCDNNDDCFNSFQRMKEMII